MMPEEENREHAVAGKFLSIAEQAFAAQTLLKIVVSGRKHAGVEAEKISIRPVSIRGGMMLGFVYRHVSKDITQNFTLQEGLSELGKLLKNDFNNADLFTTDAVHYLKTMKSGRQKYSRHARITNTETVSLEHDRAADVYLGKEQPLYLYELGITGKEGKVRKEMQHKFRQMNHYVRLLEGILKHLPAEKTLHIADMGSGKGYLTLALYDFLVNREGRSARVTGVEQRPELVEQSNRIAAASKFKDLHFVTGRIDNYVPAAKLDVLIALHACDTATDDAIWQGIRAGAEIIVVAPCCHKQLRKEMRSPASIEGITRHGILLERQAEILTDSMRALLLEMNGYRTRVFEFIETEHTPKNLMIAAERADRPVQVIQEAERRYKDLKEIFGTGTPHLEKLIAAG